MSKSFLAELPPQMVRFTLIKGQNVQIPAAGMTAVTRVADFCRAMLCKYVLCRYAVSACLSVCPSVHVSVAFVNSVKTKKYIFTIFLSIG